MLLVACAGSLKSQPRLPEIVVHAEMRVVAPPGIVAAFDRFVLGYAGQLREQLRGGAGNCWEFWAVLTGETRRRNRFRISVTGKAGELEIPLGQFSSGKASARVQGIVKRSVALWRDPFMSALARGDAGAIETVLTGAPRK